MSTHRIQQGLVIVLLLTAAALLAYTKLWAQQEPAQVATHAQAIEYTILRTNKPVAKGSAIAPDDIALEERTAPPPAGAFAHSADVKNRIAVRAIAANEILSQSNTQLVLTPAALANAVPPGLRAISLYVSEDTGVAHLLRPGDHVDVLVVSKAEHEEAGGLFPPGEAKMLVQNVAVLAVGQSTDRNTAPPRNSRDVTLAVTPEDAATLALIRTIGREYLVLRRKGDETITPAAHASTADLGLGAPQARPSAPFAPRPAGHTVEIIKGTGPATRIRSDGGAL